MAKNDLFRVSIIGGYNKEDVQEYIKTLENEIESVKILCQKEKDTLVRQLERSGGGTASEEETAGLREELRQKSEELKAKEEELLNMRKELSQKEELLREQKASGAQQREKLDRSGERHEERRENQKLQEELRRTAEELQEMQAQNERLREHLSGRGKNLEEDFLDQKMIADIMADARKNAELIREEALKEREEILKAAEEEADQMKAELAARVNRELEDKGIQLIAAKHKIAQYMKEVKFAQEGLYNVYSRMNYIVENMPARLDNYWDGEHYRMLEDSLKEEHKESKHGEDGKK